MTSFDVNSDGGEIGDSMKAFTDINCLLNERYGGLFWYPRLGWELGWVPHVNNGTQNRPHGYSHPKSLGEGSYGVVMRFRRRQNEGDVAVKRVFLNNVSEGEGQLWFGLKHENIVALLEWTIFESLNVICFEMEVYGQGLFTVVRKVAEALQQLKMWLYQAPSGINFLYERQLCHLDITSDNGLISRRAKRALIADFAFLRRTSSHIRR
ncbi:hypothetical protein AVEN_240045-1 [Araneus ventricosus]|uniref:Protein kinase domain-containing protein n=1 Tax=Araneus ventricosus TaxID=182803 RepID=A0A4Y2UR44_ARAVE|nr:hypothetical protein AVEN_240045-1 [Araneus ventricosus]